MLLTVLIGTVSRLSVSMKALPLGLPSTSAARGGNSPPEALQREAGGGDSSPEALKRELSEVQAQVESEKRELERLRSGQAPGEGSSKAWWGFGSSAEL